MSGRRRAAALAAVLGAAGLAVAAGVAWWGGDGGSGAGAPAAGPPDAPAARDTQAARAGRDGAGTGARAGVRRSGPHSQRVSVASPQPGAAVASPLVVAGEAPGGWYFEATFPLRLVDGDGRTVADSFAGARGEWMTSEPVPYRGVIRFPGRAAGSGTLVLERANASGLPEHDAAVRVPVRLAGPGAPRVHFPNSIVDPEGLECASVHPVVRPRRSGAEGGDASPGAAVGGDRASGAGVGDTPPAAQPGEADVEAEARRLLSELSAGPRPSERAAGYHTALPEGVEVRGVELRGGVLTADFGRGLDRGVAGSCRVRAIRAQIDSTLARLPGVRRVEITVAGRAEGILQP